MVATIYNISSGPVTGLESPLRVARGAARDVPRGAACVRMCRHNARGGRDVCAGRGVHPGMRAMHVSMGSLSQLLSKKY
jgi:hypothetical protein